MQTRFASQLHTLGALYEYSLILNTRVAPFNDIRVRQALNYAVDRAEVARLVGAGAQPTCQTLTPWFTGYERYCPYTLDPTPSGIWRAPDLPAARRLITASHTGGTPVTIWLSYGAPRAAARYLVKLLDGLGYPARVRDVSTDPTGYAQIADSRTKAQAFSLWNYAPYPSASQLIEIYFGCKYFIPNSPLNGNIAEFCDPSLDAQMRSALAAEANNSPDLAATLGPSRPHRLRRRAAGAARSPNLHDLRLQAGRRLTKPAPRKASCQTSSGSAERGSLDALFRWNRLGLDSVDSRRRR